MMMGLQDIHWAERNVAHWAERNVAEDPSPWHLTDLSRMTLQLHACISWESWPDIIEYVLLLNVFNM